MRLGEELRRQRKEKGYSLRAMEPLAGIRYVTINEIELGKGKNGPLLNTVKQIAKGGEFDIHRVAHAAFDLDEPELMDELNSRLKRLFELANRLDDEQLAMAIGYIESKLEKGGDAFAKPEPTQTGYG